MGNKLLIIALASWMLGMVAVANDDLAKIDSFVEKIKVEREGLDPAIIKTISDPFYYNKEFLAKKQQELAKIQAPAYRLYSIFNNRAKINGKWYILGDKVGSYRLANISQESAVLRRGNQTLTLFVPKTKKSKNLSITTKKKDSL